MKSFHIISTGVSLISNLQRKKAVIAGVDISAIKISDEQRWRELLDNPVFLKEFQALFANNPPENLHDACAELNTFLVVAISSLKMITWHGNLQKSQ